MVAHVWSVSFFSFFMLRWTDHSDLDMMNIFEVFLPQLLRYPNPNDPLNGEAASLLMRHPKEYEAKVKGTFYCAFRGCQMPMILPEYVQRFATKEAIDAAMADDADDEDEVMSEVGSLSDVGDD